MRWLAWIGTVVVFHLSHAEVAWGCGATLDRVEQFLPASDATDVPLDAALFVAANFSMPTAMVVRQVLDEPSGDALLPLAPSSEVAPQDGGAAASDAATAPEVNDVEVTLTCYDAAGDHLCVGKPTFLLAANSTYEWSVITQDENSSAMIRTTLPQRFTTGNQVARLTGQSLRADVTEHVYGEAYSPCGPGAISDTRKVTVGLTGVELDSPLVVKAPLGMWQSWGVVLTPEENKRALVLDEPPECFVVEAFDVTGNVVETSEICPERILPVVVSPEVIEPAPSAASTSDVTLTTPTIYDTSTSGATQADNAETASEPAPDDPAAGVRHNAVESNTDSGTCAVTSRPRRATPILPLFGLVALGAAAAWRRRMNA